MQGNFRVFRNRVPQDARGKDTVKRRRWKHGPAMDLHGAVRLRLQADDFKFSGRHAAAALDNTKLHAATSAASARASRFASSFSAFSTLMSFLSICSASSWSPSALA